MKWPWTKRKQYKIGSVYSIPSKELDEDNFSNKLWVCTGVNNEGMMFRRTNSLDENKSHYIALKYGSYGLKEAWEIPDTDPTKVYKMFKTDELRMEERL